MSGSEPPNTRTHPDLRAAINSTLGSKPPSVRTANPEKSAYLAGLAALLRKNIQPLRSRYAHASEPTYLPKSTPRDQMIPQAFQHVPSHARPRRKNGPCCGGHLLRSMWPRLTQETRARPPLAKGPGTPANSLPPFTSVSAEV